jgi:hypothetical protein
MYTCDWPASGGVCGKQAFWFANGGAYHRPLCVEHSLEYQGSRSDVRRIDEIDPAKVPQKILTQAERKRLTGVRRNGRPFPDVFTAADAAPPPSVAPPLSRPPLREALADVAISFLRNLKKKLDEEAK